MGWLESKIRRYWIDINEFLKIKNPVYVILKVDQDEILGWTEK